MFKFKEALRNEETGEERYVFDLNSGNTVVVKFFDPIQSEKATVKWFIGSYSAVRSHWRTLTPFEPTDQQLMSARSTVDEAIIDLTISASSHQSNYRPPRVDHRTPVYFGPPGSGKSTRTKLDGGFDLETVAPELRQAAIRAMTSGPWSHTRIGDYATSTTRGYGLPASVGAADQQPAHFDRRYFKLILLLPRRDLYLESRAARDRALPEKSKQPDVYYDFARNSALYDDIIVD